MPPLTPDNDDRQTVQGRVIAGDRIAVVKTDAIKIGPDGTAVAEVVFDRPITIPLEAIFSHQEVSEIAGVLGEIAASESDRFDDLFELSRVDVKRALAGMRFDGCEFVGTADRPLNMVGWNLSGCDFSDAKFEHILVDETTIIAGAILKGIHGEDARLILSLPSCDYQEDISPGPGI